ncbi:MAG: hypothetical protein H7Y38_14935 [Armatimonadetes bacterium]|nr:hypothetical protein [Armatimonadota bacterium]
MTTHPTKSVETVSTIEKIVAVLNSTELEKSWREALAAWEDSSPSQRADCRSFIVNLRDNFVRVLRDVDDPAEQETVAALFYTQAKAQWILINTQSGYQLSSGRMDGSLFCRAGMLSALLGAMEPLLRVSDLTRITNFLAEPTEDSQQEQHDAAMLSELLGADVQATEPLADGTFTGQVMVDAAALENRLRFLVTLSEENKREWHELQDDLGVSAREEIVPLFETLKHSTAGEPAEGDAAIAHAARSEWAERRELQLRSLRKEVGMMQAERAQIERETGATNADALVAAWREAKNNANQLTEKIAQEQTNLSAVRVEYGVAVTGAQIIEEMRRLSSELADTQARYAELRTQADFLEREFGTFHAQQMVDAVRQLRDQITKLMATQERENAHRAALAQEFGAADTPTIIERGREMRDQLAAVSREIVTLRAERYVLQNELGASDAREIVARIQALEKEVAGFREMGELLGSMDAALKNLNR